MATYVSLFRMTATGRKDITASLQRGDVVRDMLAQFGVEIVTYYMTLGAYDFVFVFEAPDEKAMAKALMSIGRLGAVETQTMITIGPEDYQEALEAVAGLEGERQ